MVKIQIKYSKFKKSFFIDPRFNSNQFQSFDRLYRTRSESQPPYETVQNEPQEVTNNQQVKSLDLFKSPSSFISSVQQVFN
jgi:hypothetical protein